MLWALGKTGAAASQALGVQCAVRGPCSAGAGLVARSSSAAWAPQRVGLRGCPEPRVSGTLPSLDTGQAGHIPCQLSGNAEQAELRITQNSLLFMLQLCGWLIHTDDHRTFWTVSATPQPSTSGHRMSTSKPELLLEEKFNLTGTCVGRARGKGNSWGLRS